MTKTKQFFSIVFGLCVVGLVWLFYEIISLTLQTLTTLDPNVSIAIVAGSATILASTLTVVITRYYQTKRDSEAVHRDKKIDLYDKLLFKLFEIFLGDEKDKKNNANLVPFLREIQRKIILWSGPDVIRSYAEWHRELTTQKDTPRAKAMIKMTDFFLALRKDLGHSNAGIEHEHLIRFMLKNSDLFMQMYNDNPDVTFEEISQKEQELEK
jgi:hypothetical protein